MALRGQRVAVVDVGSNTVRLLVATQADGHLCSVQERRARLALGAEIERNSKLSKAKVAETALAVRAFVGEARELGARPIEVVVASPGRQAANASRLLAELERASATAVRVLSREEEAVLGWEGAVAVASPRAATLGVCDVGGGSTQVSVGSPVSGPVWLRSFDIGSLRLTARVFDGDPPDAPLFARATAHGERACAAQARRADARRGGAV